MVVYADLRCFDVGYGKVNHTNNRLVMHQRELSNHMTIIDYLKEVTYAS